MPSKKSTAPSKSASSAKSGSAKDGKSTAKGATKPVAKPASKPAVKPPAKPPAKPVPKPVNAKDAKPAAPSPVKHGQKPAAPVGKPSAKPELKTPDPKAAKVPAAPLKTAVPVKPFVKPKPIPFTIKNDRASSPFNRVPTPPPKPAGKPDPKTAKPDARLLSYGPKAKYTVITADVMAASRAAAAKLAAAAGLHPVKATGNSDAPARSYTRVTKTPFDKKEIAEFREMLLVKRRQIEGDVNAMESGALTGGGSGALSHLPQHMADQGTDTFDQSLALDLAASQRGLLKEIDDALARIEAGTYGICEEMGKPIGVERLRHTPWARYCIEAARLHERAAYFR